MSSVPNMLIPKVPILKILKTESFRYGTVFEGNQPKIPVPNRKHQSSKTQKVGNWRRKLFSTVH
ncbi:hypothetical protein HanIR_Chr11g0558951 [Helianthus annuus]|nr:hypothetical protein HanIR_Chr11g0558951 [Helianthus annuus]